MNITLTRSCGERLTAQAALFLRVPHHVSEECIFSQACRMQLQLPGSRMDHSRPFKMHPIHAKKNHINNQKQTLLLVQKPPEMLNSAVWDEFHRLELFGGVLSTAGTV